MRTPERIAVVGGSLGGVRAAETLREEGFDGTLTVIDGDRHAPYDRYHLSKDYLEGFRDIAGISLPVAHIEADWMQGRLARRLDLTHSLIELDDGTSVEFDAVVIATGSHARQLAPAEMALTGVMSLRTLADAQALRAAMLEPPTDMVIVGGGLIGSEIASVAARWGIRTTIIDTAPLPLMRTLGAELARAVVSLHKRHDVALFYGVGIAGLEGHNGSVRALHLTDGQVLPASLVVVCLGVTPNTSWLAGSGLTLADGVVCEETLFAEGRSDVVVVGDAARWPVPICGPEPIRVEHWRSTLDQASHAPRNLLNGLEDATPYRDLPVFGTHIHGMHFRSNGFPPSATSSRLEWGDPEEGCALVSFYRDDVLIGAIALEAEERLGEWRERIADSPLIAGH